MIGMKRNLLSFQIGDQLFSAVNGHLIGYAHQQPTISLNPFVNLDALFTHRIPPSSGGERLLIYDSRMAILFPRKF